MNRRAPSTVNDMTNNVSRTMTRLILLSFTILGFFPQIAFAESPMQDACELVLNQAKLTPESDCFAIEVISGIGPCVEPPMAMITNGCETSIELEHPESDKCETFPCPFEDIAVDPGESLVLSVATHNDRWVQDLEYSEAWDIDVVQEDASYLFNLAYSYRRVEHAQVPSTTNVFGCRQVGGENTALWVMLLSLGLFVDRRGRKKIR